MCACAHARCLYVRAPPLLFLFLNCFFVFEWLGEEKRGEEVFFSSRQIEGGEERERPALFFV